MYSEPNIVLQEGLLKWSKYLLGLVLILGIGVLSGWFLNIGFLVKPLWGLPAMGPACALAFICSSFSILLLSSLGAANTKIKRIVGKILVCSVLLIASLRMMQFIAGFAFDVDHFLFSPKRGEILGNTNFRMPSISALCFLISSISILLLNFETSAKKMPGQVLALIIGGFGLLSLFGYMFQIKSFYGLGNYKSMSLETSVCFLLISLAILYVNPGKGIMKKFSIQSTDSFTAVSLIPFAFIIPALLGSLRLLSYWSGMYSPEFRTVVLILGYIAIVLGMLKYISSLLNRKDLMRKRLEQKLLQVEQGFRLLVDNVADYAIFMVDARGFVKSWNEGAKRIKGYTAEEIIGKHISAFYTQDEIDKGEPEYNLKMAIEKGHYERETWRVRKDGTQFWADTVFTAIYDDQHRLLGIAKVTRDMTKLRKFNENLEAQVALNAAELTNIFERVTDAFIAFDKDGKITYANKKAAELNKRKAEDIIGKNIWTELPEERNALFLENLHKAIATQQNMQFEFYSSILGIWIENNLYPSPEGISYFFRDITQKKRSEEQILREKELSDTIINSLPGIFYLFDSNGKFLRWNKNLETVSGYSTDEINEMSPLDFFESDEKDYVLERIDEVNKKGTSDMEANFVTKDSQRIPYYFTGKAVSYLDRICLIGTGINISHRIKEEQQLRLSVQKYKLLFESNPLPMWMVSLPDLTIIDVNKSTLNHYGYTREEFLSLDSKELGQCGDLEMPIKELKIHLPGISKQGVSRHKKKDGSVIYADINSYDFIYEGKQARLLLSHDITEKVIAEESLKKSYENIRLLASHLQNIREEERAGIAREIHDQLGQQLTGLKMDMSWVSKRIHSAQDEQIKHRIDGALELLDNTIKTVRKIATDLRPSIIDDLGAIAAIEWQSQEFEKRSGIVTHFKSGIAELDFPPGLAIGLFRICQESLTNIGRHSGAKNIEITLEEMNKVVILKIADDGIGFVMQQIGHKKTLGLLGMKERALMMGGDFEITSIPGRGTTLTTRIPVHHRNN